MKFRDTLTPASGFQSAQYRKIEFASTELINLIDIRFRATIDRDTPFSHAFDHLYWQAAGKDYKTGKKSALISLFEDKYMEEFITFMKTYNTLNLWTKFKSLPTEDQQDVELINENTDTTSNIYYGFVLNEILYDPPAFLEGDSNNDSVRDPNDDEFIEFVNDTDSIFDLSTRTPINNFSYYAFKANPFLGVGFKNYSTIELEDIAEIVRKDKNIAIFKDG